MQTSTVVPAASEDEIVAFLSNPATYPEAPQCVDVIETHCARVFLAGDEAYKVKKHVRLPFLDFSTLEQRHRATSREVEINQPHAQAIYIGLVPITRGAGGVLRLGGQGQAVEWAVHMKRFKQEELLANQADNGPLPDALCKAIAEVAARFHRTAAITTDIDGAKDIGTVVRQLVERLGGAQQLSDDDKVPVFVDRSRNALERISPLLRARSKAGCLRRCHGDLHLGNIVLIEDAPVPFDALEFNEEFATIDVLYDLAFLLMDLDNRGDRHAANIVLNAYCSMAPVGGELEGLACLPLFLACRAGVRAIVGLERMEQLRGLARQAEKERVRNFSQLASNYLTPPPPVLIAVGGLSGTGKSTIAAGFAHRVGAAPGALHMRSDVERKRLFGVAEIERLDPGYYQPDVTDQVYTVLLDKARLTLAAGHGAVIDAVFAEPKERAAVEALALELGIQFEGLWLEAPSETMMQRVGARRGDASDADCAVVARQLGYDTGQIHWHRVNTSGAFAASLSIAEAALRSAGIRLAE
jgi:aminoglycoside phosphotransferase family enzyme/cytidylate kinase